MVSILTVEELMAPLRLLQETGKSAPSPSSSSQESWSSEPTNAVIFVGISLVLGIACRHVLRGTRVPYTLALLLLGIGLGSLGFLFLFYLSSLLEFQSSFLFHSSTYTCIDIYVSWTAGCLK